MISFSWKDSIESRLAFLENALAQSTGAGVQPLGLSAGYDVVRSEELRSSTNDSRPIHSNSDQQSWEVVVDSGEMPAAIPASYISEISSPSQKQTRLEQTASLDMIACNILHKHDAHVLFELYRDRLDRFLYAILGIHKTLSDVRTASSILTDAICTVAALHSKSANYGACRAAFMEQVSALTFSKKATVDDVRGLCIGAFWLSDLSWALIGLGECLAPSLMLTDTPATAVRIANEINLNRAFVRPQYTSRTWYMNARLYLLVHVCDRHLSIVYGRAPMSETFHNIGAFGDFLESENASDNDQRLVSQLEIWSINYRTYKVFGLDSQGALPSTYLNDFRRINIALDTWRADWEEKFASRPDEVDNSRHTVGLHYDFAKLYLCSHAYRGFLSRQEQGLEINPDLEEFAAKAVAAAESILRTINTDQEIQSDLHGLPTYFDTMIAFAVVFLLKVSAKAPLWLQRDNTAIIKLLEDTSTTLRSIVNYMRTEHILSSITRSVKKLIEKASTALVDQSASNSILSPSGPQNPILNFPWLVSPDDSIFVGNFDLTGPAQDIDFNFLDFSSQY